MPNLLPATLALVLAGPAQQPQVQEAAPQEQSKPPSSKERGKAANDAYKRGEFQFAADAFQAIVEADPAFQAAWMGLASSLKVLGKLDEAADAFSKAASLGGDSGASARCMLAVLLMKKGDSEGALRELTKALNDATDSLRSQLAEAARGDPDLESLRNNPRFREIVGLPLNLTVPSSARDAAYRFLGTCSTPFDVGLLRDERVLLYLDRSDYRDPGAPFLLRPEDCPSVPTQAADSIDQVRTYCRGTLSPFEGARPEWSKARLCGQLFGYPVGVMNDDKLFIYFYEFGTVAFIEQPIVSILDLLLKQKAGTQEISLERLQLDSTGVLEQLRESARPINTIKGQFDILFGYDPFAALVADASHALHEKGLIRDPRNLMRLDADRTTGRPFENTLFRLRGNPSPGMVKMSWPPSVDGHGLTAIETTARAIVSQMRETETVFISLFEGLKVADHESEVPTDSAEFWSFFLAKDWSWWEQPRLVALLSGKQIDPAVITAFRLHAQVNAATEDFGGAWKAYFERLNMTLRSQMTRTLDEIAIEGEALDEVLSKKPPKHPDIPKDPRRLARELATARIALKYDLVPLSEQELPARLARHRYFESAPTLLLAHDDSPEQPRFLQLDVSGAESNVYQVRYGMIAKNGARSFTPWVGWYGGQRGRGYGLQGEGRELKLWITAGPCLRMTDVRRFARTTSESLDGWHFSLYLVQANGGPRLQGFAHPQSHGERDTEPSSKSPSIIALEVVPTLESGQK